MDYELAKKKTVEAMSHPKVGMRFSEMLSYWVYVVAVLPGGGVITRSFSGHPANPPADCIKYETLSAFAFAKLLEGMLYCDSKGLKSIKNEIYCTSKDLGY